METTLNIRIDIYKKIKAASRSQGIPLSHLIAILIKKVMDDMSHQGHFGRLVQYQERRNRGEWHKFHWYVREDDYEYFQDLRKLMKMSVSLILAYAVEKFLYTVLKGNNTDNNRYRNYLIIRDVIDDIVCWKFIWGFPPHLEKFLL